MGLGEPVPMGPEEKKAFKLFMRSYVKMHAGMQRKDINWKGLNAWGRMNRLQRRMFASKSALTLHSALLKKDPPAQKKKEAKPKAVKAPPGKPKAVKVPPGKPKAVKVTPGKPKAKKAGKAPPRKDDQSAKKEDAELTKKIEEIANAIFPNFNPNPYSNPELYPSFNLDAAAVVAKPKKKVRQVKKKAQGPRKPVAAAGKTKQAVQKRAKKTIKKLAADKGKNKKSPAKKAPAKKAPPKKAPVKKAPPKKKEVTEIKQNQNQPKKEDNEDLKNPEPPKKKWFFGFM